jgi:hypothetical protein
MQAPPPLGKVVASCQPFLFILFSTIYNAVLNHSPQARNTNSTYSKTTLCIARYYIPGPQSLLLAGNYRHKACSLFQDNVTLLSGECGHEPAGRGDHHVHPRIALESPPTGTHHRGRGSRWKAFFLFLFLNQQFITRCSIAVCSKPYKLKYSLRVYTCKIVRDTAALMSPFRVVMSPARAKRGQENDKECWALRCLPKPALAPDADHPRHVQSTPKDVPSRSWTHV